MDRKSICEAQAAICREQASRGESDREFWLAEAQRWQNLAGEQVHAVVCFDLVATASRGTDREARRRDEQPSPRN